MTAHHENDLIPARTVRNRFGGVSSMTLWRWVRDENLGFPQPIAINKVRYWKAIDIDRFIEARRATS